MQKPSLPTSLMLSALCALLALAAVFAAPPASAQACPPVICVSPEPLVGFNVRWKEENQSRTFFVSNCAESEGECQDLTWSINLAELPDWITIPEGQPIISGRLAPKESATITFNFEKNPSCEARAANIQIIADPGTLPRPVSGVRVVQGGRTMPEFCVTPADRTVGADAGVARFEVWNYGEDFGIDQGIGCVGIRWSASTNCDWAVIEDQSSSDQVLRPGERAPFTVRYLDNNNTCDTRNCTITVTAQAENAPDVATDEATLTQDFGGPPVLELDKVTVNVDSAIGEFTFGVKNTGCGVLDWTITENCDWILPITSSGSVAAGRRTNVRVAYLPNTSCGRSCQLTVSSPNGGTQVLVVEQTPGGTPELNVTAATTELGAGAGAATFAIKNSGCGVLEWSASASCDWMAPFPSGSVDPGVEALVIVPYDANTDLEARSCEITVSAPNTTGSPQTIAFTQRGTARAALAITPASAQVNANSGTTALTVRNTGEASMNWSIAASCNWATASPAAGTLAPGATADVAIAYTENTGTQSRSCALTVSAQGAVGSPITFNLTQAPGQQGILSVTPASRSVGSGAVTATYTVSNAGTGAMPWSASSTASWVAGISPSSGTVQPGGQATVSVSLAENPAGASRGTTVTFTAPGALGSPAAVNLIQAANEHPALTVTPATLDVGPEAGSKTFSIANTGGGALSWTVTAECGWVRGVTPASGTLYEGQNAPVTVSFDANTAAKRECTLRVTGTGVADSPKLVTISQNAEGAAAISLEPATLELAAEAGTMSFTVRNTGDKNLNWSVSAECDWFTIVSASSGTLVPGATVLVTINHTANVSPGTRTCVITVQGAGAQDSPAALTVNQAGTEIPGCCTFNKSVGSDLGEQLKRYLGDLLLMGLSLLTVLAMARIRRG